MMSIYYSIGFQSTFMRRKIEAQKIAPSYILPIFQKRFFRLWLDAILPNYPAILNFRRINQENTIQEFASLDKIQFEIAKARIKGKHLLVTCQVIFLLTYNVFVI